jgi:hypothetical protein
MTQNIDDKEQMERSLIDIAVESWRFSRLFGKVVSKLDAGESGRYINQFRYFQKKIEESLGSSGLKLVNVEGQPYDAGMAASALNLGDFGPDDVLLGFYPVFADTSEKPDTGRKECRYGQEKEVQPGVQARCCGADSTTWHELRTGGSGAGYRGQFADPLEA